MTRTIYYTATSLDGIIADEGATLEWLLHQDQDTAGPLNYDEFIAGIGAMVMGSTTYEWVLQHDKGKWQYEIPSWVMTTRDLPKADGDIRFASGDVRAVHAEMAAAAGGKDLWMVGGGDLAGQFADAGLLDEIIVYIAPVTLGSGAPLLNRPLNLKLEEVHQNRAFACARYSVVGPWAPPEAPASGDDDGDDDGDGDG
ncbi:MAG TPA: dihydrofolate reductase family protein [Acidimicrobiales bacterium]